MSQSPLKESVRLSALQDLKVLDTESEAEFQAIAQAAAAICGVSIAQITLVDESQQWFRANVGLDDITQTPRSVVFCGYTILSDELLEVTDALADPRFADNPLVTGQPHIRFYAGAPLCLSDGSRVGSLCVIEDQPRELTAAQRDALLHLSRAASQALESRRVAHEQRDQQRRSAQLLQQTGALARVGGWELDLHTNELIWSEQTSLIHGLLPGYQPQLEEAFEFCAPESRERVRKAVEQAISDGTGWDTEFRLNRADGRSIWVRMVGEVDTSSGKAIRLRGAIQDIDEHVRWRHELENAHERITIATDNGQIAVWEYDIKSGTMSWAPQMFSLYGLPTQQSALSYADWLNCLHQDDRHQVEQTLAAAIAGKGNLEDEFRVCWPDGSVHHLRSTAHIKRDARGRALKMLGVNWDVTSLRSLTSELAEKHELLHVTLQSIDDAVITADTDGLVTWLNPSAERLTGWACADALKKPLEMIYKIVHEQTRFHLDNPAIECLRFGKRVGQIRNTVLLSQSGVEYGIEDSAAPICDAENQMLGVVLVFRDVTEQRRLTSEMTYRATHDELTDVLNRSEFESRLQQCLENVNQEAGRHALLFIDLDQFKLVNDACGHSAGDQLLRQMAGMLTQSLREGDTLARLGGDEFGVILHHCEARMAKDIAQDICDRMDDFRFSHGERRFRIGTSIGLVPLDGRWANTAAIMQAADTSCYAAKEAGRNRVHMWFDTDKEMRDRRGHMQWATRLEQSLDEGRFELYAQRLESMHAPGVLLDAEVLLRLKDDTGTIILPGAFLPAAERFHLATRIDRWVLQQSIVTLAGAEDLSRIGKLWINLSGQSISDRVFHKDAFQLLKLAGRAICERICLEITETAAVTNIADAANFISKLRELGVSTALDDFGAGASSFGYLKSMPVDMLKIDGQFITRVLQDPLDEAAVRCFVDVANVVGLKTVAEHVQSVEVLERVREIGVDYAQGFLLHKPEPINQLLAPQECELQRLESV